MGNSFLLLSPSFTRGPRSQDRGLLVFVRAKTHLDKQLAIIEPKIIVLMGSVAAQGVLGEKIPVKTEHGKVIERNGKKYFITVHPAAGLRFPPLRETFQEDFQKLREVLHSAG